VAFNVTVKARDAFGNVATGYGGTVRISTTGGQPTLPPDFSFAVADAGVHTFTGIVLRTLGTRLLTAADTSPSSPTEAATAAVRVVAATLAPSTTTQTQTQSDPQQTSTTTAPLMSATATTDPSLSGSVTVASTTAAVNAPTTVAWAPTTFGSAPVHLSATVEAPVKAAGVEFAAGSAVIQIDAVTNSGQQITTLSDVLDIALPNAPAGVAPMYQRGSDPWVVIPRLGGKTLPAGQPDGWYLDGATLHILTRHLTKFGLAKALTVKWGTRRRVHLRWAHRIVVYGAPSVDAQATYTLRRGKTVYGRWTRTLPAGKGAPANLWLAGKHMKRGLYRLTIDVHAGPQHWVQVVAIRYL
jgi:hypothetical protein